MNRIEIQLVKDSFQKMYIHSVFWPSESGNILNMIGNRKCPLSAEQSFFRRVFKWHRLASMRFYFISVAILSACHISKVIRCKK